MHKILGFTRRLACMIFGYLNSISNGSLSFSETINRRKKIHATKMSTQREISGYSNLINTVKFVFDHIFRLELSLEKWL